MDLAIGIGVVFEDESDTRQQDKVGKEEEQ